MLVSDGDLMEGVSQQAIALAGHWRLNKMIVLYDDNGISPSTARPPLSDLVDQVKSASSPRARLLSWIDGQDAAAIAAAIARAEGSPASLR